MREIAIYITVLGAAIPICENPIIAQNVADEMNGPDSHCVKGDETGQWLIEEPVPPYLVDEHGIGRAYDVGNGEGRPVRVMVEDAYCFYGTDMPKSLLCKLPKAVLEKVTAPKCNMSRETNDS